MSLESALASSADFVVRPATTYDELNYVRKTWLREYAEQAFPPVALVYGDVFMQGHKEFLESALERGAVAIAGRASVPSSICGFAVTEGDAIHFVYVKPRWRKLGAARLLLAPFAGQPAKYTHKTLMLRSLPVPAAWTFNPYPFLRNP